MMHLRPFSALLTAAVLCGGVTVAVSASGRRHTDPQADPAAYALLKEAHDSREAFPAGFAGMSADIRLNDNGKQLTGAMTYSSAGDLKVTLNDASKDEEDWTKDQIETALSHRRRDDFAHGDGSNPITFVQDDHSPLGRQLALNDGFKSYYRVKDRQITEVTRTMGNMRFTITVLENLTVDGGKYLPRQFVVTYFDAGTGALTKMDAYTDGFTRISGAWIPTSRRVVSAENGGFTTRILELRNVHLLPTATAALKK